MIRSLDREKKAQQMTLSTIIIIVLGLVVLIFLIYGFSTGWGNLWQRVTGLGGGKVNADTIKTSCTLACQQENVHGWCSQVRDVNLGKDETTGKTIEGTATCEELAKGTAKDTLKDKDLGISCSAITCNP